MMALTEHEAQAIFERARWPAGPICPRCKKINSATRLASRPRLLTCSSGCRACQFSVTCDTPLHGSRVPFARWADLIGILEIEGHKPTPAQAARYLAVSHVTASTMLRRVAALEHTHPIMYASIISQLRQPRQSAA